MDAGDCFHFPLGIPSYDPHLWIVLKTDSKSSQLIMVNLTTEKSQSDKTTIIIPGEHRFVKHSTIVSYADAKISLIARVEEAMESNLAKKDISVSPELLTRICDGLIKSRYTPIKVKEFYLQRSS
jgi:hypothetical protein